MNEQNFTPQVAQHVLQYLQKSIDSSPSWYKAWHTWATCNFEFAGMFDKKKNKGAGAFSVSDQMTYVDAAVRGFFRSIALCSRNEGIQDTLRLLTLWFRHGGDKRIEIALQEGFNTVSIDTWLQVIPQIIARMDASNATVRTQINELLSRISKEHPQAIVYPLTLAAKSQVCQPATSSSLVLIKIF
jgi:FKBP12-rapamycin complex-associated protein